MTTAPESLATASTRPAPTDFFGIIKQLGPGLIISAIIVGSGELIVTPKLGAAVGFQLLWFIILACFIKVFVQIELGRFAIANGLTTLQVVLLWISVLSMALAGLYKVGEELAKVFR